MTLCFSILVDAEKWLNLSNRQKFFSRSTLENVKKDGPCEKSLNDETCPDFNELQPVEERYSYLSSFSNGKVSFQTTGTTKGIFPNFPRPHLTILLFHSANNSSSQTSQQADDDRHQEHQISNAEGNIFIERFDQIFGQDQSEVTCNEESDVKSKLRILKDISLSKHPSRRSKLLEEGKIMG